MSDGLSNPSQLLERSGARLETGSLLLLNPPPDGIYTRLAGASAVTLDWSDYRILRSQGSDARFGLEAAASAEGFSQVVIFLTKAKARTRMLLDFAATAAAGGSVWLVGEKKAGIGSVVRLLAEAVGPPVKLDAARHCMLFEARNASHQPRPFALEPYWRIDRWQLDEQELAVASLPGVFSHGELDPGTRLLLAHLQIENQREALDFGSGCGIVSALLGRQGARVTAIDSDALALAATTRTLALNAVLEAKVIAADRLSQLPGRFDLIVSNPPFHQGTRTATATAHALIRKAPERLRPGGRLLLVANAFLDYPRVLTAAFGGYQVIAQDNRYRVYEARSRTRRPC